ncbi:predicted protein [Nematostella vectensis]|uniref:Uncharacterized protein n=1 Tax=Nematostella vectensis TaxID=45351 RepID=A7T0X5_NEMVE|nr:predicted protein [Nematostella vectensis]|eukprot:XP_001622492.1 predicted protein [Nematostella vectensis]
MSLPLASPSHAGAQQRVAPLLTPQAIEAPSLAQQLQLERTKQENLKLQLELTKAQLELARFNAPISAPVEPLADVLSSTPARPLTDVPNLATLRKLRRDRAVLPNEFLFTTSKGTLEYDKLDISEFVGGFLECIKSKSEPERPTLVAHLQLLMEKAASYSWSSVRNFHFSISSAIEAGRLTWNDATVIRDRAQIAFTHADLRSASQSAPRNGISSAAKAKKELYCKDWNHTGKYFCPPTDPAYKSVLLCRVCDANHSMLSCAKRRFPIPNTGPVVVPGGKRH